jgi:hypothetical protein
MSNAATMENKTTTQVVCKEYEMGLQEGREYTQIRRYELYKGFWLRTILINGKEQNFEDHLFRDL